MPLVNKAFGDIITFTRASAATRINALGVLESVAANVPRLDYDPVTLACRGLLIEEQRTNMLLNSATLSTQSVAVTGLAKTLSFTGTGSIVLSGAHTATLNGTGANNRVALTFTPSAGTLTLTVTGDVRNAQLEVGAFATSWIPTTGAQATRAGDSTSINTLSPWYNQSEGTLFAEFVCFSFARHQPIVRIGDNTADFVRFYARDSPPGAVTFQVQDNNVMRLNVAPANVTTVNAAAKAAIAYNSAGQAGSLNGVVATALSGAIGPINATSLDCGVLGGVGAGFMNGYLRKIRYIPKRLTNAELQALTA